MTSVLSALVAAALFVSVGVACGGEESAGEARAPRSERTEEAPRPTLSADDQAALGGLVTRFFDQLAVGAAELAWDLLADETRAGMSFGDLRSTAFAVHRAAPGAFVHDGVRAVDVAGDRVAFTVEGRYTDASLRIGTAEGTLLSIAAVRERGRWYLLLDPTWFTENRLRVQPD